MELVAGWPGSARLPAARRRSAVVAVALIAACGRDVSSGSGEATGDARGGQGEKPQAAAPAGAGSQAAAAGAGSQAAAAGAGSQAAAAAGGAGSQAAARVPDRRPALVFLGDSLTAGYGLSAAEAVPVLIQAEIDRAGLGLRVINAGRSGDTTAGGKSRVDFYLRPEIAPRGLVVWLGANDMMRGLATSEIEANLRAIIRRGRRFDRALQVFLVQMRAFPNLGADYAREFEAIYPRVAQSEGAILIQFPMSDVAGRPELNQPDGIHPNAEGARKVAQALWRGLVPHLASR